MGCFCFNRWELGNHMKKIIGLLCLLIPVFAQSKVHIAQGDNANLGSVTASSVTITGNGIRWPDGTVQISSPPASGASMIPGASYYAQINPASQQSGSINIATIYYGSLVNTAFSIASFSDSLSSTLLIGTGEWKAAGGITFAATYTNGPSTGAYVSKSGWSNLTMTGAGYVGPTNSGEAVNYPSVAGTVVFTLHAGKGTETDTETITHTFYNYRMWGTSSTVTGYTEADIEGLAGSELSNSKAKTFTVVPGVNDYIVYAYPSRLGTATFTVGGFEGGFELPETVSVTNSSGYQENYYVYRSTNKNLGSTTVTVN